MIFTTAPKVSLLESVAFLLNAEKGEIWKRSERGFYIITAVFPVFTVFMARSKTRSREISMTCKTFGTSAKLRNSDQMAFETFSLNKVRSCAMARENIVQLTVSTFVLEILANKASASKLFISQ